DVCGRRVTLPRSRWPPLSRIPRRRSNIPLNLLALPTPVFLRQRLIRRLPIRSAISGTPLQPSASRSCPIQELMLLKGAQHCCRNRPPIQLGKSIRHRLHFGSKNCPRRLNFLSTAEPCTTWIQRAKSV